MLLRLAMLVLALLVGGRVAEARAAPEFESVREEDRTPLDHVNRQNMRLNDWLTLRVADPLARAYNWTVPKWGQRRVSSVLRNLTGPRDIIHSLLQGKLHRASVHTARFVADSLFGVAGLFEVGVPIFDLRAPPETANETLGVYSVGTGPFLIIPFIGETSPRGLVGATADAVLYPLSWIPPTGLSSPVSTGGRVLEGMGSISRRMPARGSPPESWERYENLRDALISTPYGERKRLFFENEAWDVAR
jgi:phospholipid-binding lipoprotein MlaA